MQFNQQLTNRLLIGTQSNTRRRLFKDAGLNFKYLSPNIDEKKILSKMQISQSKEALFLAKAKALSLSKLNRNKKIICFDTTVHIKNKTIFKSSTKKECMGVLLSLNGKTHTLYTACVIMENEKILWSIIEKASVTFNNNSKIALIKYVNKNFNKIVNSVGCYNIEAEGKALIKKIKGSYYAILGVPLISLFRKLKK
ncbi:Maf family protein [Alphaproteobacteria bacterium]|nr:Maf family protein [Alphaproteobacteria bacterium]